MRRSKRLRAAAKSNTNTVMNIQAEDLATDDCSADGEVAPAFRFLDLPAEIRNRIYSYATAGKSRDISYFRIPTITHVSKQVRKECLPVLFADNNFICYVGSDFWTPYSKRHPRTWTYPAYGESVEQRLQKAAGTLRLKHRSRQFLECAGAETVLLKDITLYVFDTSLISSVRAAQYKGKSPLYEESVKLHLRYTQKKMSIVVERSQSLQETEYRKIAIAGVQLSDVHDAVERASQVARNIAARDGFKGFTLADIKAVAWAFRF